MKSKVQTKRKTSATPKTAQKSWDKLHARPFEPEGTTEQNSVQNQEIAAPNQAQVDRVARSPNLGNNLAAMPLYASETVDLGGMVQTKPNAEENLKSPQGTINRKVEDQKEQLPLQAKPESSPKIEKEDDKAVQLKPESSQAKKDELQRKLADRQEETLQQKAEVETEAEKDEEVQMQLKEEQSQTLQRKEKAAESEDALNQTKQELVKAQDE